MNRRKLSSKFLILGFFAIIILLLMIPLAFLLSTRTQTTQRQKEEPTPTPAYFTPGPAMIAGYVYDDADKDGERGTDEKPIKGMIIHIKQITKNGEAKITTIKTDPQGYFRSRFSLNPDNPISFTVSVILPDGYETNNANPILISDLRPGRDRILEFGVFSTKPQLKADQPLAETPTPTETKKKKISTATITPKPTTP